MSEIQDKYMEPLEGDPVALGEKVEFEKKDLPEKAPISDESVSKKQEILELERKLAEKKQELSQEVIPEKIKKQEAEIIKEKKVIKEEITPTASKSKLSSKIKDQINKLKELDRENQIKELCKLSFSEDLDFAVNVAKGLDSAYVLDEFHDALVDELYDKLVEKGELKKI